MESNFTSLEPGIYFNLPAEEYHNDSSLSRTGIVNLLISPRDYWENSIFNPRRERKQSKAKEFGEQCHMLLLEPKKFHDTYRIKNLQPFTEESRHKKSMDYLDYKKLEACIGLIRDDSLYQHLFSQGYPEVTIVWEGFLGYRFRARIDYLLPYAGIDYKTTRTVKKEEVGYEFGEYGYDLQNALYVWGLQTVKAQLAEKQIKAFGEYNQEWLDEFTSTPECLFEYLCQRSVAPHIYERFNIEKEVTENCLIQIHTATEIYDKYFREYGASEWPHSSGVTHTLTMHQFTRKSQNRGINLT